MENCSTNLNHAIKWSELCFPEEISLEKIVRSGQCFRPREIFPSCFRFITKDSILYLKQVSAKELAFYINITEEGDGEARENTEKQWKKIWLPYFDGKRKYGKIERKSREDDYLQKCIAYGKGLRVLRQDPFETLLTFILSQRKSIPAIRSSVEKLCERFGEKQYSKVEEKEVYLFPRAEALQDADFSECSLGYRAPFVRDAVERVLEKRLDLRALDKVPTEELLSKLMEVHGVGIKVADCVALFAYYRMDIIKEDVWM